MTQFDAYRWEDHVPRAGSWKFNLAAGALALALISAAFPGTDKTPSAAIAARPAGEVSEPHTEFSSASRPTVQLVESRRVSCPSAATPYADS
jgi:hypothetical protein